MALLQYFVHGAQRPNCKFPKVTSTRDRLTGAARAPSFGSDAGLLIENQLTKLSISPLLFSVDGVKIGAFYLIH
jgi:hypothetical protein